MAFATALKLSRADLSALRPPSTASITNVEHLASYNWVETANPTIAVPGVPSVWSPRKGPQRLSKDSGHIYIAQNAARHPDSPLEPLFRALYLANPTFDIRSAQVVTDRNNIRKLLSFVNPSLGKTEQEAFTINIEMAKNTSIFCRAETKTQEYIGPHEFRGFGHEFEKAYTNCSLRGSTGHFRIISYQFGGLKLIVRHETDGYVGNTVGIGSAVTSSQETDRDILSGMLGSLSLSPSPPAATTTKLEVREEGHVVPRESTLEIKTRVSHRPLELSEVAPQLWASQTPKLVRAYHTKGVFQQPEVKDVAHDIRKWEEAHQEDLKTLAALMGRLIDMVKECGGAAIVRYDPITDNMVVQKVLRKKMLPEDLYSKWDDVPNPNLVLSGADEVVGVGPASVAKAAGNAEGKTRKHGNPNDTPFYEEINHAVTNGFRQFFRKLPVQLPSYHLLCQTLDSLQIDVLGGRTIRDMMADMRRGKSDWDPEERQENGGIKSVARDSAFRLVYTILQGTFTSDIHGDKNRVYNAAEFVVTHPRIFKSRARKMVREAYAERFQISQKQRQHLDKWPITNAGLEETDETTEEENFEYYDSDYSF